MQFVITENFNTVPQNRKIHWSGTGVQANIDTGLYFCREVIITMKFSITQEPVLITYEMVKPTAILTLDEPSLSNGEMARLQNLDISKTSWSFEHKTGIEIGNIIIDWTDSLNYDIRVLLIGL